MGMAQLVTPLPVSMRAGVHSLKPTYRKLGMVVHACNTSAVEVTQSFLHFFVAPLPPVVLGFQGWMDLM